VLDSELTRPADSLATVRTSADTLSILNDVLDFSKIESRKLELEPYRSPPLCDCGRAQAARPARTRKARAHLRHRPAVPPASWRPTRMQQVLTNLSQCAKFTERGTSSSPSEESARGGTKLHFSVTDTGSASAGATRRIFEAFRQADARRRAVRRTGLG